MTWDKTMQERAVTEGWRLIHTVDSGDTHVYLMVAVADTRFTDMHQAIEHIVNRARSGSTLHQHALYVMSSSRLRPTTPKAKTKR